MTSGIESHQTSEPAAGLPCPQCKTLIQFTIQTLLRSPTVHCQNCGLALTIDAQKSEVAVEALQKFSNEIDAIQQNQDPDSA